jgi:hypothetical protein
MAAQCEHPDSRASALSATRQIVVVGRPYDVREHIGGWFARGVFNP